MEEVIRRAQQGDRDAMAHLWRTYQHLLLRYFRAKGSADPDDLASVVWIEVATSIQRFEGGEPDFRRWLFTIAARRRIDGIRASQRAGDRLTRIQQLRPNDQTPTAADNSEQSAELERALALIRTLPADQAEAVALRVIADLTVAEVAEIMGKREGTVRVLVHRGLKRLAERLHVTDAPSRSMFSA